MHNKVHNLETSKAFRKDFKGLPKQIQNRLARAYNKLASDPFNLRKELRIKKLQAYEKTFALRVGDYRTFYQIQGKTIILDAVEHRQSAYKK